MYRKQELHGDVTNLKLLDVVGRDVQTDADGDEDKTNDKEGGQHGACSEDRLPGWQPLLFEGRILGLFAPQGAAAGTTGP